MYTLEANEKGVEGSENREGLPLISRLEGLRCVVSFPIPSSGRKRVLVHFELELTHVVTTEFILDTSVTHRQGHQSANFWGALS